MKFSDKIASARRGLEAINAVVPQSEDIRRAVAALIWLNWWAGIAAAALVFTLCHIAAQLLA